MNKDMDMQIFGMLKEYVIAKARQVAEDIYNNGDEDDIYCELTLAIDVLERGYICKGAKVDYIALWQFVLDHIK